MVKDAKAPSVSLAPATIRSDEPSHDEQVAKERAWESSAVVREVRGLSKRFGGIVAAEDLDIDLHRGSITALVGPNGAGKTTVFNLLTGFIKPDRGSVRLNGAELTGHQPNEVARRGMVRSFQDVRLFMRLSCLQNVAMANRTSPRRSRSSTAAYVMRSGRVILEETVAQMKARDSYWDLF